MILETHQLSVTLGRRTVLQGVDLSLSAEAVTGLIGPNGAGKTTLLRALAGLLPIASGTITLDGRPLARWPRRELARRLAYLPQGAPCSWPISVRRAVALGRLPHLPGWGRPTAADASVIEAALAATDVLHVAERSMLALSGGERGRVMLARALAGTPRILLADEPVAGLDPEHQLRVMALLRARAHEGLAVIVTVHDLSLAGRFCDRLIALDGGEIAAEGAPSDVLTPSVLAALFAVSGEFGSRDGQHYVVPWTAVPRLRSVAGSQDDRDCCR